MNLFTRVVLFMLLLVSVSSSDEEFDYSNGPKGPLNWGDLKEEWRTCKVGKSQSPIDIQYDELQPVCALRLLQGKYNATSARLTSTNHDVELKFPENAGSLLIDGTLYKLSEYHIHAPSEHSFNGRKYAVEGHLVHKSSEGKIAVVSVVYKVGGEDDVFIDQVEHLLPMSTNATGTHVNLVDPSKVNISGKRFFRYMGSLTTPPCTEGVLWNILKHPRNISKKQYKLLMNSLQGVNDRFVQNANGRKVSFYK